jgi:hypothetical protein
MGVENGIAETRGLTATIAAAGTLSDAIQIGPWKYMGLVMPAVWATAGMTFAVCNKADGTFLPLYDDAGIEVSATVAASKATALNLAALSLAPWNYVKLRSGTVASAVAQAGPKATKTIAVDGAKTLTFTSGVGGTASNAITVAIEVAENDTLAVAASGPAITIKLANTTDSKNAASAIQTAARLLTISGVTMTGFVVTGSTEYDAAPPTGASVGTEAEVVLTPATGKTLTIGSGLAGSNYNDLKFAVATAEDDVLAVAESGGTITITLAKTTASNNAAAAIQTLVQALTVEGYTMTAFTVEANAAYTSAPPVAGTVAATNMAGGDESVVAATALAGGDDTHIEVVLKA